MALLYYMLCQLRGSKANWYAGMAELADAHGSGPCDYCSHEGSSPFSCILHQRCSKQFNTQEWRNWQTRTVQVRVTIAVMRVQVPFPASLKSAENICWFFCRKEKNWYFNDISFLREQWNISFYKYNHSLDTCNNFSHLCFLLFAMFYKYNHFLNTCNE